jgi:integrase
VAAAVAAANTFGAITTEYLNRLKQKGCSETTIEKNRWLLEDLAKALKNRPISAITPAEILIIMQKIEKTGRRETARRLRSANLHESGHLTQEFEAGTMANRQRRAELATGWPC